MNRPEGYPSHQMSLTEQLIDFATHVNTRNPYDAYMRTWLVDPNRDLAVYVRTGIRDIGPIIALTREEGEWVPIQKWIPTLEAVTFEDPCSLDPVPMNRILDFAEEALSTGLWDGFCFETTTEPEIREWCRAHNWQRRADGYEEFFGIYLPKTDETVLQGLDRRLPTYTRAALEATVMPPQENIQ